MNYYEYCPEDEKEFNCTVCDKPIDWEGVCSQTCFNTDMM